MTVETPVQAFGRILHRCEIALVYAAAIACAGMMLLTSADAMSR